MVANNFTDKMDGAGNGTDEYVDLTKIEKTENIIWAYRSLVKAEFYEFDEPIHLDVAAIRGQNTLLPEKLPFKRLLYICYSPEFKTHVFRGYPNTDHAKYKKTEFYVRLRPDAPYKLKHIKGAQDTKHYWHNSKNDTDKKKNRR